MNHYDATITAIATPLGIGGVGIIRISGEKSLEILQKIFQKSPKNPEKVDFIPNYATHGWIVDNGELLDEVIAIYFKAPHSYTGEDVVEINCHGGMKVLNNVLNLIFKNGAEPAQKGEFTKRAFLNQKMDMGQAEAVLDIIHAKTDKLSKNATKNLSGSLSSYIKEVKNNLIEILAKINAALDFPEDVPEPDYDSILDVINTTLSKIQKALDGAKSSNLMRQGLKIAIIGQTNVGKSSLFNTLLDSERAIVTNIAGTTRDVLQESLDIEGIPVTIMDTAGIRETNNDIVEEIGIEYSKKCLKEADIVLFLYDITKGIQEQDKELINLLKDKPHIKIASKIDLLDGEKEAEILAISCKTGQGIEELKQKIKELVSENNAMENTEFITNIRQQKCLKNAQNSLKNAQNGAKNQDLQDLISIDLKTALLHLDEITGEVVTDDILAHIFEQFCIGK